MFFGLRQGTEKDHLMAAHIGSAGPMFSTISNLQR